MLRSFWGKLFKWNGLFGFVLILLFGIPRFIIVLQANQTGNYRYVPIIFIIMWIAPFVLLTREGRSFIGMRKTRNYHWLFISLFTGAAACAVMFMIAELCFGNSVNNWFVYISKSYSVVDLIRNATSEQKQAYFLIYALAGMTFSPIGEELMYRGLIHGSFAAQLGEKQASLVDSLAFSLTHLAHFGIVYLSGVWTFLPLPGVLWVLLMLGTSLLFFFCKEKTGSLLGAIFCHAGFNLAMTYFIFYHILNR